MKRFLSFSVLFLHLVGALSSVQAGPLGGNWAKVGDSFKHFSPKLADPDSRAVLTPQTCKSIITTVAGGGKSPILNDGVQQATSVGFGYPSGVVTDADGIYINDNGAGFIDKVDASGVISIAHDMNVLVDDYKLHIVSIALDIEKNLYVVSAVEAGVGKINVEGIGSTVAGGGTADVSDGVPATTVKLNASRVVVDAERNLYISAPFAEKVFKVDTKGIISTVAGTGETGFSGDGDLATKAKLSWPTGIAVDPEGNLYISVTGRIRKVDTKGMISTVAGNGTIGFSLNGGLATTKSLSSLPAIAVDPEGNLYIAEPDFHRVRKVDTKGMISAVAGNGTAGFSGDGDLATRAQLNFPTAVAVDAKGNLYIADTRNRRIRRVSCDQSVAPFSPDKPLPHELQSPDLISDPSKLTAPSPEL